MTERLLDWERITHRRDVSGLQSFTCTTDVPRTPGGRKLPHPKPWEREVQSHFRQISRRLRQGELLLLGCAEDGEARAAIHLMFEISAKVLGVFVASIAVCTSVRGKNGMIANEALLLVHEEARDKANRSCVETVVITGNIHTENRPSEQLFSRAGFEPLSIPNGPYQTWAKQLSVTSQSAYETQDTEPAPV